MKRRVSLAAIALLLLVAAGQPGAVSSSLVISQVYGGGGNAGSTYRNDFIELFNRGAVPVSLSGMSVQYAAATGTTWQVTVLSGTVAPGQYYLVQEAVGAGGTVNLPTPDATGTIALSATAGKVALASSTTAFASMCPTGAVDFIGYGGANCSEGSPTPALTNTTAASRNANGCTDTDNNATDFSAGAPAPRNTSSSVNACSGATNPSGIGAANPASVAPGGTTLLTVNVSPGSGPTSTGISVAADLSTIGGSAAQTFHDDGANTFSFQAIVSAGATPGARLLAATITDAQSRTGGATIALTVAAPPPMNLRINQIQRSGGGSPIARKNGAAPRLRTAVSAEGLFLLS